MKYAIVIFNSLFIVSISIYGQGSFSLSIPAIYNTVEVPNNWSPPTAINRKNQFNGTSWGYGANVIYSFNPKFLNLDKNFTINIGGGYFKQRFNLQRPFNYNSPVEIIYYTDHYSYDNIQGIVGVSYKFPLKDNYSFNANFSYNWLNSFRQKYTPTYGSTSRDHSQIEHRKYVFGNILTFSFGLKKHWKDKYSLGLNLVFPLYTQWRMDKIFDDDPTKYFYPKPRGGNISSIGGNISFEYYLKSK